MGRRQQNAGAVSLDLSPKTCNVVQMRRIVDLDSMLESELSDVVSLTKEKATVVIRQALRAGLPVIAGRFRSVRPAMSNVKQKPERWIFTNGRFGKAGQ